MWRNSCLQVRLLPRSCPQDDKVWREEEVGYKRSQLDRFGAGLQRFGRGRGTSGSASNTGAWWGAYLHFARSQQGCCKLPACAIVGIKDCCLLGREVRDGSPTHEVVAAGLEGLVEVLKPESTVERAHLPCNQDVDRYIATILCALQLTPQTQSVSATCQTRHRNDRHRIRHLAAYAAVNNAVTFGTNGGARYGPEGRSSCAAGEWQAA
jgi:hypothetical protein